MRGVSASEIVLLSWLLTRASLQTCKCGGVLAPQTAVVSVFAPPRSPPASWLRGSHTSPRARRPRWPSRRSEVSTQEGPRQAAWLKRQSGLALGSFLYSASPSIEENIAVCIKNEGRLLQSPPGVALRPSLMGLGE